jgi:antitoxin CptB
MDHNRLKWAARRGMLELDLILQPFVEKVYPTLNAELKNDFADTPL